MAGSSTSLDQLFIVQQMISHNYRNDSMFPSPREMCSAHALGYQHGNYQGKSFLLHITNYATVSKNLIDRDDSIH